MSRARGPGYCFKAMWWGWGGDAGCCDKPAFGPTPSRIHGRPFEGVPLPWACPEHGGPPKCDVTETLRDHAMKQVREAS